MIFFHCSAFSRAILAYLVSSYAKDDTLYPQDVRMRALVDQRVQFDLGTLYARLIDYMVSKCERQEMLRTADALIYQ